MTQKFDVNITEFNWYGFDDTHALELLPGGYFVKADNVFVTDNKITKVFGSTAVAASIAARPFNGAAAFEKISSSVKYLVVNINGASNAQLYQWSGSGTFTAIGSANITNSKPMWFEVAKDILYGFNGSEVVTWDGTSYAKNPASVPLAFYGRWFHNYLFAANTAAQPNRLFWSNLGDPTTFDGANLVDVNPGDSDQIMGLSGIQDELLVFKRNTIWSITGFSGTTFSSTTLAAQNTNGRIFGYGCVAPFSIIPVGNEVYFFSMLGNSPVIRSLRKTINAVTLGGGIVSEAIRGTLDTINKSALSAIVSGFDGRFCYWGVPTGSSTTPNKIIALDTWKTRSSRNIYPFTTMTGKNPAYFAVSTIPGYSTIYFADASSTSGLVFKFDTSVYTDNGSNIAIDVVSRGFMGNPSAKTHWKYMYLKYNTGVSSTLNVYAKVDGLQNYTLQKAVSLASMSPGLGPTGTFTLGVSLLGGATLGYTRVPFAQQTGKILQFEFTETSANAVTIYEHSLMGLAKALRAN